MAQTEEQGQQTVVVVNEKNLKSMFGLTDDIFFYLIREGLPRIEIPWADADGKSGGTHYLFDQGEVYHWLRRVFLKDGEHVAT